MNFTIASASRRLLFSLLAGFAVLLIGAGSAAAEPPPGPGHSGLHHQRVCGPVMLGEARCDSAIVTNAGGKPLVTSAPAGYGPGELRSAYNLAAASASNGSGQTIAIVDAYDDPNAEADLGVYRSHYGLPACTGGGTSPCFKKVNQSGGTAMPRSDSGWAQEISLDLDMASAICPNCKILLVEATSNSFANLGAAEDYAAAHATVVSNSYGGSEFSGETGLSYDGHFTHPGVAITASSGDNGYGVEFPAASQHVTAVGGTTLTRDATTARGWKESAWSKAGSGCSAYVAKPEWQTDSCSHRTVADVSADADPNTGVAVYDTLRTRGWLVFGGTSVAAPIVAGVYALAGNASTVTYGSYPYSHAGALNDVTTGANGSCGGSYPCTAVLGYDGPTGLGTPNGTGGF
ncbi:MAG: S53 family peptidase [Solirubrobacterales bacterium]